MEAKKYAFPYTAWRLMPSFKPAQVELVEEKTNWGAAPSWHLDAGGKYFCLRELYESKEAAIAAGLSALSEQELKLKKMQQSIDKKRVMLSKAAS